jgi:hypothetical protein
MTTLIERPDKLAKKAHSGLLEREAIAAMLRENLRRHDVVELFQAMDRMADVETPPVMLPEEVAEEIRKKSWKFLHDDIT